MTTQTAPEIAPIDLGNDEGHLYCCNPTRALCGRAIDPADDGGPLADGEEVACRICHLAQQTAKGCGARFCRLRSWWSDLRAGR